MKKEVEKIIDKLKLTPHPEGGFYKETYRSGGSIRRSDTDIRNYSTAIYFLLTSNTFSAFHKINQDEIWHFYEGSTIELHIISEEGHYKKHLIGKDIFKQEVFQLVVPANHWFAARLIEKNSYGLVGCTVSPGFDFKDFMLGKREELLQKFPQYYQLIVELTHT